MESPNPQPSAVLQRFQSAQNQHDLDTFVACFAPDYRSEQPAYPDRTFIGREQVRKNWSALFSTVHDFRSELLRTAALDKTEWSEWRWYGTRSDGTLLDLRVVTIFGIENDLITWGRLYIEPMQDSNEGIDTSVKRLIHQ